MNNGRILILGATGRTGRILVALLEQRGHAVRALVRDMDSARQMLGPQAELTEGDLRDAAVLARAADGCRQIVFLAAAVGDPGRGVPRDIDFGAVAALASVLQPGQITRFVLLSSAAVTQPEHPHNCTFDSVLKWKLRGEEALRASGLPYTIVRALGLRDRLGGEQGIRIVQGDRIAFGEDIARADVAAFLADVVGPTVPCGFADGFNAHSLIGATCEIFNDATIPPERWRARGSTLVPDTKAFG